MALKIRIHERLNEAFNPKTVKIGNQVWMAENLAIGDGGDGITVKDGTYYYTLPAAARIAKSIKGWKLPEQRDFENLIKSCGGEELAGTALLTKQCGGEDTYSFSAELTGKRGWMGYGLVGKECLFWSNTTVGHPPKEYDAAYEYRTMFLLPSGYGAISGEFPSVGLPIRLVKD